MEPTLIPSRTFVWRISTHPLIPLPEFIQTLRTTKNICKVHQKNKNVFAPFNKPPPEHADLWVLHNDAGGAALPPDIHSTLAFAYTTAHPAFLYVDFLCARPSAPKGAGKVLFDCIAKHAAAIQCQYLKLYPNNKDLQTVYERTYGMDCYDYGYCYFELDSTLRYKIPLFVSVSLDTLNKMAVLPGPVSAAASKKRKTIEPEYDLDGFDLELFLKEMRTPTLCCVTMDR